MIPNPVRVAALILSLSGALCAAPAPAATVVKPEAPAASAEAGPNVGITPKGGGVFIKSDDGRAVFRLMGYAQPTFIATAQSNKQAYKVPSFFVRRARADFKAEYDSLYTLFFEYDGGPGSGNSLVEAYAQAALVRDYLNFRLGKYIQPFSAENLRSSRALETVERFQALNALVGLPAFDAKIGAMAFGTLDPAKQIKYFLSVDNGGGSAPLTSTASNGGDVRDNNSDKDFIARFEYSPIKTFRVGVAGDLDKEAGQPLLVKSYSGAAYIDTVHIYGTRVGLDVDLHYQLNALGLEGEWLWANFPDTNVSLQGGYVQAGYWVKGNEADGGVEPLLRLEYTTLSAKHAVPAIDGATLMSGTLGVNYWMNGWTRWQVDLIEETTSKKGTGAAYKNSSGEFLPTLFAQFQIKF